MTKGCYLIGFFKNTPIPIAPIPNLHRNDDIEACFGKSHAQMTMINKRKLPPGENKFSSFILIKGANDCRSYMQH